MSDPKQLAADVRDAVNMLNERIKAAQEAGLSVEIEPRTSEWQNLNMPFPRRVTTVYANITQPL